MSRLIQGSWVEIGSYSSDFNQMFNYFCCFFSINYNSNNSCPQGTSHFGTTLQDKQADQYNRLFSSTSLTLITALFHLLRLPEFPYWKAIEPVALLCFSFHPYLLKLAGTNYTNFDLLEAVKYLDYYLYSMAFGLSCRSFSKFRYDKQLKLDSRQSEAFRV